MRANEFLKEDVPSPTTFSSYLWNRCEKFLKEVGGLTKYKALPLWRGVKNGPTNENPIIEVPCPSNRKPLSTKIAIHEIADKWFLEQSGIGYRSNAFFTVGSNWVADEYGEPAIFVPIGDYEYAWSPEIDDFYNKTFTMRHSKTLEHDIINTLEGGNYQFNTGLVGAIRTNNEIMIHCKSAYLIYPLYFKRLT